MSARSSSRPLALLPLAVLAGSCITQGYPLGHGGAVDIRVQTTGPLFAADQLDTNGKPIGARQAPYSTPVDLYITESGQAAWGGFVSVRIDPQQGLTLSSATDEKNPKQPSCSAVENAFNCKADTEGYARFVVTSPADWSGDATILVTWADQTAKQVVHILPAGVPPDATTFQLLVGGLDDASHVLASYLPLQCTIGPVPDDLGSKWRPGMIRSRQAFVRATPPPGAPGEIENAPVVIESLSSEGAIALSDDCADRLPRNRVLLDKTGESAPFYMCFSDVGGTLTFAVTSGQKVLDPPKQILVDAEPRLLRVRTLQSEVPIGAFVNIFEVTAYNADRVRIPMIVDVTMGDTSVLALSEAQVMIAGDGSDATVLQATPFKVGTTVLHVSPLLLAKPDCTSPPVTVVPADTLPPP